MVNMAWTRDDEDMIQVCVVCGNHYVINLQCQKVTCSNTCEDEFLSVKKDNHVYAKTNAQS